VPLDPAYKAGGFRGTLPATTIKIDDRRDREVTIAGKKRAVERKLG